MLDLKIEHYKRDTGLEFPEYYLLSLDESLERLNKCSNNNHKDLDTIYSELISSLQLIANNVETGDVSGVFELAGIGTESNIMLYWDKDEAIIMKWGDVINVWDDLWYGYDVGQEAMILVFEEQKKLLLITHYGDIYSN